MSGRQDEPRAAGSLDVGPSLPEQVRQIEIRRRGGRVALLARAGDEKDIGNGLRLLALGQRPDEPQQIVAPGLRDRLTLGQVLYGRAVDQVGLTTDHPGG